MLPFAREKLGLGRWLALVAWTGLHLWISARRSFWQDEYMRYQQMMMSLSDALVSLFREPSPFAPGEILLGWVSGSLLRGITEFEFWGRLPSVFWGSVTFWYALRYGRSWLLPLLMAGSVAMTSFCTQFRPYAALIFAGALAFRIVWDQRPLSRAEKGLFVLTVLTSHIYGICYLALAAAFRRRYLVAAAVSFYVVAILGVYMLFHQGQVTGWAKSTEPTVFTWELLSFIVRDTFRTLANPRWATHALAPFFIYQLWREGRASIINLAKILILFFSVLVAPVLASYAGNYGYVSRQIVGGIFPFLALAAVGVEQGWDVLSARIGRGLSQWKPAIIACYVLMAFWSWFIYFLEGSRPYPEQPLHKYALIVRDVKARNETSVLLLDPGNTGFHYFEREFGPIHTEEPIKLRGFTFIRRCWASGICVLHMDEPRYAFEGLSSLAKSVEFQIFMHEYKPAFQRVIFNDVRFEGSIPALYSRAF